MIQDICPGYDDSLQSIMIEKDVPEINFPSSNIDSRKFYLHEQNQFSMLLYSPSSETNKNCGLKLVNDENCENNFGISEKVSHCRKKSPSRLYDLIISVLKYYYLFNLI